MKKASVIIFFAMIILSSCYYDNKEDLYQYYNNQCDTTAISYSVDVEPIINTQCVSCHQAPSPSGSTLLSTYSEVKASAQLGKLYGTVTGNGYSIMPPTGKMAQCNLDKIDAWIKAGMPNN